MPKFKIDYTLYQTFNDGQLEVEAETLDEAIEQVRGLLDEMPIPQRLIDGAGSLTWAIDTDPTEEEALEYV